MADLIALEVYAGKDRSHSLILLEEDDTALNITDATITINVKKSRDAKTNVLTLVTPTQITIDDAAGGLATAVFTDVLTDGLVGIYWMELIVVTTGNDELKLFEGTLNILP